MARQPNKLRGLEDKNRSLLGNMSLNCVANHDEIDCNLMDQSLPFFMHPVKVQTFFFGLTTCAIGGLLRRATLWTPLPSVGYSRLLQRGCLSRRPDFWAI
jgi:hypothetical protein